MQSFKLHFYYSSLAISLDKKALSITIQSVILSPNQFDFLTR